jgi:methyl halide transferase
MVSVQESSYWEQRYHEGSDRWDLGQPAPPFVSWLESHATSLPRGRVAVLGCGRGYDALLFASYGFEVVGFDFAPAAIVAATKNAASTGSSAQFLQRNIFDLSLEFPSHFDLVIEHTCFCAIAPEQRAAYVQLVHNILRPQGEFLGLFFTHDRPSGPPFGVTPNEIRQYFEPKFEILSLTPVTNSIPERQGEEHLGHFRAKA